ncbi:MAG: fluoride efflux transporter CrcB [Actinomycetes bacterium]
MAASPYRALAGEGLTVAAVAVGGALGALARYGMTQALPPETGRFPWATFLTNLVGCFAIGMLLVFISEAYRAHRLVRPFLGVGVLGGFTTFSAYAVEYTALVEDQATGTALVYLVATPAVALAAALAGVSLTRALLRARRHGR